MNETLPSWWLILSGLFFALNTVLFGVLIFVGIRLSKAIQEVTPKVNDLTVKVNGLVTQVHAVAVRVEEVAKTVNDTVSDVGGKASRIAGTAEGFTQTATRNFERITPLVMGAFKVFKFVRGIQEARSHRKDRRQPRKRGLLRRR